MSQIRTAYFSFVWILGYLDVGAFVVVDIYLFLTVIIYFL